MNSVDRWVLERHCLLIFEADLQSLSNVIKSVFSQHPRTHKQETSPKL